MHFCESRKKIPPMPFGWRLECSIADLVLKCQQRPPLESVEEDDIFALFNRRSGPISVTVEQSSD